jgi:hypothetical protein
LTILGTFPFPVILILSLPLESLPLLSAIDWQQFPH